MRFSITTMKFFKIDKFFIGLIGVILISGCHERFYAPLAQNVPLFKEKDEVRVSLNYTENDHIEFANLMAAYALSDKFAIQANVNLLFSEGSRLFELDLAKNGGEGSLAFGWYKPLNEKLRFEIFGGDAIGYRNNTPDRYEYLRFRYNKLFLQPSIGLTTNLLDLALTTSFSYMNMFISNVYDRDGELTDVSRNKIAEEIQNKRHSLLFEPGFTLRIGSKLRKFQLQAVHSFNLSHPELPYDRFSVSFGLFVSPDFRSKE